MIGVFCFSSILTLLSICCGLDGLMAYDVDGAKMSDNNFRATVVFMLGVIGVTLSLILATLAIK